MEDPLLSAQALRWTRRAKVATLISQSAVEHVRDICTNLLKQQSLCDVCQSVSTQISDFLHSSRNDRSIARQYDHLGPRQVGHENDFYSLYSDGFRILPPETVGVSADANVPPGIIRHHREARSLLKSAKTCALCNLIRIACVMDASRKREHPFDVPTKALTALLASLKLEDNGMRVNSTLFELEHSKEPIFLQLLQSFSFDQTGRIEDFTLDHIQIIWQRPEVPRGKENRNVVFTTLNTFLPTGSSSELKRYVDDRQPLRSSGSLEAFDLIRTWMRECRTHHDWCMRSISGETLDVSDCHQFPTRVIDTGPPGSTADPRLVITKSYPPGQWVALSHCWGPPDKHPLKTTAENVEDYKKGIPISTLPKTFVDAIVVTRAIGLRYLWIDSLCIIQDDRADWLAESKVMGLVYERAVLTIAATAAWNSTEGLFLPRDYGVLPIASVRLPLHRENRNQSTRELMGQYNVAIEWRQEPFTQPPNPLFWPLSTRGWATQEWVLSRRTVHFLEGHMTWICKCRQEDEVGRMIMGQKLSDAEWCTEWGRIIAYHSMREFTYIKDKLISLEGLAQLIAKTKGFQQIDLNTLQMTPWTNNPNYWFGTWENDMPEHLLWGPLSIAPRLKEFPSWSWAAHSKAIVLRFREFDNNREDSFETKCKIIGCDTESGALSIRAKNHRIDHLLTRRMEEQGWDGYWNKAKAYRKPYLQGYHIEAEDNDPHGWAVFDDGRELDGTERYFFLHLGIAEYTTEPRVVMWGLVLGVDSANGRYLRVGLACTWNFCWMEDTLLDGDVQIY